MRLTLRTLLAYLDDVLDPVDKEELAQKIESSDFAEDLVHRTRDTVRRLRLSAPQVVGTGMGLDPNTVAEYLDNVMPPEQVGDFERICLESDVHLAEAAACHHVLTMVLGEPADVDPISRQRMYTIAGEVTDRKQLRIEPAHTAPAIAVVAAPVQPAAQPAVLPSSYVQPRSTEIPEYLRAGSWWRSTNAVIALAALVLVGTVILLATGLPRWFGGQAKQETLTADNSAPPLDASASNNFPPVETSATQPPSAATAETTANNSAAAPLAGPPQPMTPGMPPLNPPGATPSSPVAVNTPADGDRYTVAPPVAGTPPAQSPIPTNDTTVVSNTVSDVPPNAPPFATPPTDTTAAATPANSVASIPPQSNPTGPAAPAANNLPQLPGTSPVPPPADQATASAPPVADLAVSNAAGPATLPTASPVPPSDTKAESPAGAPVAPPDSGTYLGGKTVLLRYDDKASAWFRVEPRAAVVPGERLLSLPEFRPTIALVSGLQLNLAGGTQAVIGSGDGDASDKTAAADITPAVELLYGRVVLINPTNNQKQIRLKLGPYSGVAKLDHNATLAVELERKHLPGADPRKTPSPVEARLFAPEGGIVWQDSAGEKTAAKPSRWTLAENGAAAMADDTSPPEWIDHEPVGQVSEQRYGAPVIEGTLVSNVPAAEQLLALYKGESRREVKSLVARSSIQVGLFQPFIEALRDSEQKSNWKTHIETLRSAMAMSPESANAVWQALKDQRDRAAPDLFEMLCGYNAEQIGLTPEQQKSGALLKLINWLEDDNLDYRVLAVQDLAEITGKQFMQNPAAKLGERTQNVKRWRARLEAGELKPIGQP